jgi:hypothetical protein
MAKGKSEKLSTEDELVLLRAQVEELRQLTLKLSRRCEAAEAAAADVGDLRQTLEAYKTAVDSMREQVWEIRKLPPIVEYIRQEEAIMRRGRHR